MMIIWGGTEHTIITPLSTIKPADAIIAGGSTLPLLDFAVNLDNDGKELIPFNGETGGGTSGENEVAVRTYVNNALPSLGLQGFDIKIFTVSPLRYALWVSMNDSAPPADWWTLPVVA